MDALPTTKTCKMCCMDIPQHARKCPHCHHFQDRWTTLMFHPLFMASLSVVPILLVVGLLMSPFDKGEDFDAYRHQITVTDTEIRIGKTERGVTVSVLGTMKNASNVSWKGVNFHVDFMDAAGNRVDTGAREVPYFQLPANEVSAFKLSFPCEFPDANYFKAEVRIVNARDARSRF